MLNFAHNRRENRSGKSRMGMFAAVMAVALLLGVRPAFPALLKNVPQTLTLPDGSYINCFASGDEFYHYLHDAEGYTLLQGEDGYYYYAFPEEEESGTLSISPYRYGAIDPAKLTGLVPGIKVSEKTYLNKRAASEFSQTAQSMLRSANSTNETNSTNEAASASTNVYFKGKMKVLIIFISLSDEVSPNFSTLKAAGIDSMYNAVNSASVNGFFKANSYNQLDMEAILYPTPEAGGLVRYYKDPMSRDYINNGGTLPESVNGYSGADREHALIRRALEWINKNEPLPSDIDLDMNDDGCIDNAVIVMEGYPTSWGSKLWPHQWSCYSTDAMITTGTGSKKLDRYTFQFQNLDLAVSCHELFHTLNLPDYYRYDGTLYPNGKCVTGWDPMDDNNNVLCLTYNRYKYQEKQWVTEMPVITTSGTYTLHSVLHSTNNCYLVKSPYSTQYFILEYRQKTGLYESNVPGNGLIVTRIDPRYTGVQNGPYKDEVYIFRPGGTLGDGGTLTSAHLSANSGRSKINDISSPNCFLQDGTAGGLDISNISYATADSSTITFDVNIRNISDPMSGVLVYGGYYRLNSLNDLLLFSYRLSDGAFLALPEYDDSGLYYQNFRTIHVDSDRRYFRLAPKDVSGKCVQISMKGDAPALTLGSYKSTDKDSTHQFWQVIFSSYDGYMLNNMAYPHLYLATGITDGDSAVYLKSKSSVASQRWLLNKMPAKEGSAVDFIDENAYYKILSYTGKAVQPTDKSTDKEATIQLSTSQDENESQLWSFKLSRDSAGYVITNKASGLVLDNRGLYQNGVQMVQSQDISEVQFGQQWIAAASGDYVTLVNRSSVRSLDHGGATDDGAPVTQKTSLSSTSQKWKLEEVDVFTNLLTNGGFSNSTTGWVVSSSPSSINQKGVTTYRNPRDGNYMNFYHPSAFTGTLYQRAAVATAGTYTLSAWVRSSGSTVMYIKDVKNTSNYIERSLPTTGASDDMVNLKLTLHLDPTTAEVGFKGSFIGSGWFNADDVSFFLSEADPDANVGPALPEDFSIRNTPNPSNGEIHFCYTLPASTQEATIQIYDLYGHCLDEIRNLPSEAGTHTVSYDNSSLNTGIYFYIFHLKVDDSYQRLSGKMMIKK